MQGTLCKARRSTNGEERGSHFAALSRRVFQRVCRSTQPDELFVCCRGACWYPLDLLFYYGVVLWLCCYPQVSHFMLSPLPPPSLSQAHISLRRRSKKLVPKCAPRHISVRFLRPKAPWWYGHQPLCSCRYDRTFLIGVSIPSL
jgi:hypothetical protein